MWSNTQIVGFYTFLTGNNLKLHSYSKLQLVLTCYIQGSFFILAITSSIHNIHMWSNTQIIAFYVFFTCNNLKLHRCIKFLTIIVFLKKVVKICGGHLGNGKRYKIFDSRFRLADPILVLDVLCFYTIFFSHLSSKVNI